MDLFISVVIWIAVAWCLFIYMAVFISEYRRQIFLPVALVAGAREIVHSRFPNKVKKFFATTLVYILSPTYTLVWGLLLFIGFLVIKLVARPASNVQVTTYIKSIG